MTTTYEYKYDVKTIYDTFKNNRINVVSYLGTSNNGKSGANSSAYLSYVNNFTDTYIYARKSSPSIDSDTDKNYAYLKVGNTTYNFYHGHAYTYTETVTGNGVKPILIAYDFVNQISTTLKFDKVSINHTATPINDIPQTVNVFSPVSYIIENTSNNTSNSVGPKDEYSISRDEINKLLNGKTFADFTTYVSYSYLNSKKGDGIVYEDGKDTLSADPINDIHVWSLSDGVDMKPHTYVNNDETAVNAYTYLNCGNILNTFFRDNASNIFDVNAINYKYITFNYDDVTIPNTNGILQQWKAGIIGTDKIYAKDERTGNNILDYSKFYQVCKVDLPNVSSFNEIYNKPSLRGNSNEVNCYINIKGESNTSENQESIYINKSNINKARFVKKINNLPCHLLCNNFKLRIEIPTGIINGGNVTGGGQFRISKISVSSVLNDSEYQNNEYTITNDYLTFNVSVGDGNKLYVTDIDSNININDNNLSVTTNVDNNIGNINYTTATAYADLNFNTDNIYKEFENAYSNTTIKRIDIYGDTDILFHPSRPGNTEAKIYPDGMECSFGGVKYSINNKSNTFYTGDFHIAVTQTGVSQVVGEHACITLKLPSQIK